MKYLVLAIVLLAIPFVGAAIDSSHQCENKACIEGTAVNFTVVIYNNLKENLVVDDIYIKDLETSKILAIDLRKSKIILPGVTQDFIILSTILAPQNGYTFYYVPCFQVQAFNDSGVVAARTMCGKTIKALTVIPLSKVECRTDLECEEDYYCNTNSLYKCRPLNCLDNQSAIRHQCEDLSCNALQMAKGQKCTYNLGVIGGIAIAIIIAAGLVLTFTQRKQFKHKKVKHK
ncbi:MAG: hypothetical protein V1837_06975 [Candidatus Woesearchaeota archaeon]